jgi:hypothetical protein
MHGEQQGGPRHAGVRSGGAAVGARAHADREHRTGRRKGWPRSAGHGKSKMMERPADKLIAADEIEAAGAALASPRSRSQGLGRARSVPRPRRVAASRRLVMACVRTPPRTSKPAQRRRCDTRGGAHRGPQNGAGARLRPERRGGRVRLARPCFGRRYDAEGPRGAAASARFKASVMSPQKASTSTDRATAQFLERPVWCHTSHCVCGAAASTRARAREGLGFV